MRVHVYGCGFPGLASALGLCERGCQVSAIDPNAERVEELERGTFWGGDKDLETLINKHLSKNLNFYVEPPQESIDFCVLAIPTPLKETQLSLAALKETCQKVLQNTNFVGQPTLIVRSTLPFSGLQDLQDWLQQVTQMQPAEDFLLVYLPEFMRQGTGLDDWQNPPLALIGLEQGSLPEVITSLFFPLGFEQVLPDTAVAVKLSSNAFHALKVSFANEVHRLCEAHGVSSQQVMTIFSSDHKLNISSAYLQPGFAWGGGCLGKDLTYLMKQDEGLQVLRGTLESNNRHINFFVEKIMQQKWRKIAFLGLSFKEAINDLRESPILKLIQALANNPHIEELRIMAEPNVDLSCYLDLSEKIQWVESLNDLQGVDHLFYRDSLGLKSQSLTALNLPLTKI